MQVVEVIPIVKGIARPTFSYFTKEKFIPGSIVRVPVRSTSALGIVSSSMDAKNAKSALKGSSFALKKLSVVEKAGGLCSSFMLAIADTADFYAAANGNILSALIPKFLLENPQFLGKPYKEKPKPVREVRIIQLSEEERFREYRSIVREGFARNTSTLFIVPTRDDAIKAEKALSIGIEKYVFTAGDLTPKRLKAVLADARAERHPILFITTPSLLAFDRPDLDTIILEKENSRSYRTLARPYIHIKTFLEHYAKRKGAMLVLGDSVLSLQSLWNEREGRYSEFSPLTWRLKTGCETEVIDMKIKKEFDVLSPRLKEEMRDALTHDKKIFLFGARKGLSSTTVCGDCGSLLSCKNCGAPLVLHTGPIYACHHCGAKRSAETRCDHCQSWKLNPLGIGIDRIKEECEKGFEDAEIYVIDKEHAPTKAKAKSIAKRFEASNKAILIGTELALAYISPCPLVAAVSMDSLFSIPDFYINERIFYLVTKLREASSERFVLQTRNAGSDILGYSAAGNILDFYRTEIVEREELRYPPFSIFIKVETEDAPERIEKKAAHLQSLFKDDHPHFMLGSRGKSGKQTLSMILRLQRARWPLAELRDKLLLLTPDFLIKVDPESII